MVWTARVTSNIFQDTTPIFADPDPYVVRFKVRPLVQLDPEQSIPIFDDMIWPRLSVTRGMRVGAPNWAASVGMRNTLRRLATEDGELLFNALMEQNQRRQTYPYNDRDRRQLSQMVVRAADNKEVLVEVPEPTPDAAPQPEQPDAAQEPTYGESLKVQAKLAQIGIEMGFHIWIPRNDRQRVLALVPAAIDRSAFLTELPLNHDDVTLKTIEQIDVIWLRKRSIARAFEVEHTTAIYSGLLRMADLLALQPNMDIRLHIVAPDDKEDKVLREINRPVFSLLDRGPLYESCSFLRYSAVQEIAQIEHLRHMSDGIVDEYVVLAQDEQDE